MEEERKKGKRKKTPQNCKSPMQRQRFVTTIESVTEYTHTYIYTHKQNQNGPTKIKYSRLTW